MNKVIFKCSLRNLKQHKSKSIIIFLFIAIGIAIIQLGNSFMENVNRGMERDFRAHYSGDIMISAPIPKGCQMDLFGISSMTNITELPQIPAIPELEKIEQVIAGTEGIDKQTKVISSKAIFMNNDYAEFEMEDQSVIEAPVFFLFAGEAETYFDMFGGQRLVEGRYPEKGTNELLVDIRLKDKYEAFFKEPLELNQNILVAGANLNMILREGKVVGFYKQPNEDSCMFTLVYADPSFARIFADLTYGTAMANELPDSIDTSIATISEDDLFSDDFDDDFFSDDFEILNTDSMDFDSILGDTTLRDKLNEVDDGAWHYILLKTKHAGDAEKIIEKLNLAFTEQNLPALARNWHDATGTFTSSVEGISAIFTVLVIILAVVVFFIIMNTMTISVIERTGEIGTMRAIGAERNFVRQLFLCESVTITLFSALIGSVISLIIGAIVNSFGIQITNDIAKMILGGGAIRFIPTIGNYLQTTIIILIGTILANLYPVSSALKITPLKALSKGDE